MGASPEAQALKVARKERRREERRATTRAATARYQEKAALRKERSEARAAQSEEAQRTLAARGDLLKRLTQVPAQIGRDIAQDADNAAEFLAASYYAPRKARIDEGMNNLAALAHTFDEAPEGTKWSVDHVETAGTMPLLQKTAGKYREEIDPVSIPLPKKERPKDVRGILTQFNRLMMESPIGPMLFGAAAGSAIGGTMVEHGLKYDRAIHQEQWDEWRETDLQSDARWEAYDAQTIRGPSIIDIGAFSLTNNTATNEREHGLRSLVELVRERGSLYVSNFFLQVPDARGEVSIFRSIRIDGTTRFLFDPASSITNLWRLKNELKGSRGAASARGLAQFPPLYAQALAEGRIQRSSLLEQLEDSYSFGEGRDMGPLAVVAHGLDWNRLAADESISTERSMKDESSGMSRLEAIRTLADRIDPLLIESIFMTELMGNADGYINIAEYGMLFENGGELFVLLAPALGDPEMSLGPGQPTDQALMPGQGVGAMTPYVPRNVMQALDLPTGFANYDSTHEASDPFEFKEAIATDPSRIFSMREHRVIAYLNAIRNIIYASQISTHAGAGIDRLAALLENPELDPETRYLAMTRVAEMMGGHNNPRIMVRALSEWEKYGGNVSDSLANYTGQDRLGRHVRHYMRRIVMNYDAMRGTFGTAYERRRNAPFRPDALRPISNQQN